MGCGSGALSGHRSARRLRAWLKTPRTCHSEERSAIFALRAVLRGDEESAFIEFPAKNRTLALLEIDKLGTFFDDSLESKTHHKSPFFRKLFAD